MKQIIAMGGGGFSMEPDNLLLDQYILDQSLKKNPRICFVSTASGDQDGYIQRFYHAFHSMACKPDHLALFDPHFKDLEDFVMSQDILYVGGGSTRNLLVLWKEWGLELLFKRAYENGTVLAGLSAGANCWFEEGLTDPLNGPLYKINGLGFIKGSICPHYDGEEKRRPSFHDLVGAGRMIPGFGMEDGAAVHFKEGKVYQCISSRPNAKVYSVYENANRIHEEPLQMMYLGGLS